MKRQSQLLSALVLGAAVAIGFPAAAQQEDQREEQSEQQQQREQEQQREQQDQDEQSQQQDQQQDQQQREQDRAQPDQPQRPGERSDQQRPDDPQRARGDDQQQQQQEGDRQERQRRAMLGVAFAQDVQNQPGQQEGRQQQDGQQQEDEGEGLEIVAIMPGGAADQANLRQGDSIISINGQEIRTAEQVDRIVQQRSVGDNLDLVILRDGEEQETQVTLQAAPERDGQDARRPDFDRGAQASRGWLGVTLDTQNERSVGATIERVYPAGPAARAGLKQGDRIVQVTGREVSGYQDVLQALSDTRPGEEVELTVDSNGQQQQVSVRLDDAGVFSDGEDEFDSSTMWRDQSGRTGQIPEHDMMLEQHRRFAEQHERIERLLMEVQQDIQQIKQQLNGQSAQQPRGQQPQQFEGQAPRQPQGQQPQGQQPQGQQPQGQQPQGEAPQRPDDVQQPPRR